jgi:hypothetical protein
MTASPTRTALVESISNQLGKHSVEASISKNESYNLFAQSGRRLRVRADNTFLLLGWARRFLELNLPPSCFYTQCSTGVRMFSAPPPGHRSRCSLRLAPLKVKSAGYKTPAGR